METGLDKVVSNAAKPELRGDYSDAGADYVIDQGWGN